jgi:hypothetical protein
MSYGNGGISCSSKFPEDLIKLLQSGRKLITSQDTKILHSSYISNHIRADINPNPQIDFPYNFQ